MRVANIEDLIFKLRTSSHSEMDLVQRIRILSGLQSVVENALPSYERADVILRG